MRTQSASPKITQRGGRGFWTQERLVFLINVHLFQFLEKSSRKQRMAKESVTPFRLKKSKRVYTRNRVQCKQGKMDGALWFPVYRIVGHMRFRNQKKKKKKMVITEEVVVIWNDNRKTPAVVNVKDLDCLQLMQEYTDRIKAHGGNYERDDEGTDCIIARKKGGTQRRREKKKKIEATGGTWDKALTKPQKKQKRKRRKKKKSKSKDTATIPTAGV
ncbi:MAG: hypothetical protein BYD32DRAFT_118100 [Podila humilis]|nr:MAG: hypothetical protein BYD32DRAFT_118100 [Podila humilis]